MDGMSGPMWMPSPRPSLSGLLAVHPQPVPVVPLLALLALLAYLAGVVVVRARGGDWPWWRTASFAAGIAAVLAVTATGVAGYAMMVFSVHVAQHMTVALLAPILLLLGAPLTLVLEARPDDRLVRAALASRWLRVLLSVPARWLLFVVPLYAVYLTPAFDHLMGSMAGHTAMLALFTVGGLVFFAPLVGADPWPTSATPRSRLVEAFASTPFHAFFGVMVMTASTPVVQFFRDPPAGWGLDVLHDQAVAGGIAWIASEVPTLLLAAVVAVQWWRLTPRDETRAAREAAIAALAGRGGRAA